MLNKVGGEMMYIRRIEIPIIDKNILRTLCFSPNAAISIHSTQYIVGVGDSDHELDVRVNYFLN